MAWSEASVEAILDRYVKRDELLKDRIRRMAAAAENEAKTKTVKPPVKPAT
jgi:hypothetical protein